MIKLVSNFRLVKTRSSLYDSDLVLKRAKTGSSSSSRWLNRQKNDVHTKESKTFNYRSRAAFKLLEIDEKFKIFTRRSRNIVDLGFAPGAWTQVAVQRMRALGVDCHILGIDLINCSPPPGALFIQGDIFSRRTHEAVQDFFGTVNTNASANASATANAEGEKRVDLVLSDMMANTSGISDADHFASMELCDGALVLACSVLRAKGNLVVKFYTGKDDILLKKKLDKLFHKVYRIKPSACRKELKEMYFVGMNKRKGDVAASELFDD